MNGAPYFEEPYDGEKEEGRASVDQEGRIVGQPFPQEACPQERGQEGGPPVTEEGIAQGAQYGSQQHCFGSPTPSEASRFLTPSRLYGGARFP